jgi:two-component system, OmpR family, sensor histidine kinase KdpD
MTGSRDERPSAEEMLTRVDGHTSSRGRLRVYLGMAPGVGKTWEMLQEAHRRVGRGTDLVIGFVEPHGRPHTAELIDGLEVVPRRHIDHRGVIVEEMDTDAILARRPAVVLVDELAHTNAPGSLREKRWQDVEVIRDAGIDVVSTCNIQHLESVAGAVATITGAPVNERLPDAVLATADEIELVDMSPHALRQRMRHGNVYPPDRARIALDRFFTEANLTALRELALRFTAGRVEAELDQIAGDRGLPTSVTERVLVLVDEQPSTRRALRRGAALASTLRTRVIALTVATPSAERASFDRQRDLRENLDYAVDLGAEVVSVEDDDLVRAIIGAARRHRATQVVLAWRQRGRIDRLLRRSMSSRIIERAPDLEVHLVGPGVGPTDAFAAGAGET